jgi:hypothetical protein
MRVTTAIIPIAWEGAGFDPFWALVIWKDYASPDGFMPRYDSDQCIWY